MNKILYIYNLHSYRSWEQFCNFNNNFYNFISYLKPMGYLEGALYTLEYQPYMTVLKSAIRTADGSRTANACSSMNMLSKLPTLAVLWMVLGSTGENVKKLNIAARYQNGQRQQFYGHVVKTANAGSSMDGFGPSERKCQQNEYCSTLSKLPTLAVLWKLFGPARNKLRDTLQG